MNTYRVYVLDTTSVEAPVARVAYVRAEKYGPAWQTARAVLRGEGTGKLFNDAGATEKATFPKDCVVAKIDDIRPRNVKLDKTALKAILDDPKADAAAKVEAMTKLLTA